MHVRDAEIDQIIETDRFAGRVFQSRLRECKVLARISGICDAVRKVSHMHFPDDRVAIPFDAVEEFVLRKALGIGGIEIDDHAAIAVLLVGCQLRRNAIESAQGGHGHDFAVGGSELVASEDVTKQVRLQVVVVLRAEVVVERTS